MPKFCQTISTGIFLTYLALTAILLMFTSQEFPPQLHSTFHSSLERIWIQACVFVPVSMAFFAALWTGLGSASFLQRMFAGTPVAILSWIVFRMLGELMRAGGDTSDDNLIMAALYPSAIWILSVACFLCLRVFPLTRWRIVGPLPSAGTDHNRPQQHRAVTNILIIICTWLALLYLLKMCHQWHCVFNPMLHSPENWQPINRCAYHAIRFIPFILLAPAVTLTPWTERIFYRNHWFPLVLVLGIALACFAMTVEGFHYGNPNGTWFVYGLSSVAIPLLLLGRFGYRLRRHQSPEELDAEEQVLNLPWQRPHIASLLAVLIVLLAVVPTGKLRTVRRHLYVSHYWNDGNPIEVNDDGKITKLVIGMHATNDILQEQLSELTHLESLTIGSRRITDDGFKHLQHLPHLNYLDLGLSEYVTGSGLRYLHKSCQLKFMAATRGFTDTALKELKRHTTLEFLWLNDSQVTDIGLADLARLTNLKSLLLNSTRITDAGLIHLNGLTSLQTLYLGQTKVTDVGLETLQGLKLKDLKIPAGATTDLGLKNYLAAIKPSTELFLSGWKMTDEGLAHLKDLSNLIYLHLENTEITDAGLVHLKGLNNLEILTLAGSKVSDKGVADLQKALPNCEIQGTSDGP